MRPLCRMNTVAEGRDEMDDLISRRAAIDALNRHLDTIRVANNNTMEMIRRSEVMDCREIINGLPSAQPQPCQNHTQKAPESDTFGVKTWETCSDTISRKAAIDALGTRDPVSDSWTDEYELGAYKQLEQDRKAISEVPSAQPEPAIPLSWIEGQIEWLKSLDNAFLTLTAGQISAMMNNWKDEQNEGFNQQTGCD